MCPINPWHDVNTGEESPEVVNVIIEIPKDSKIKFELDKETGMLKLDRFIYSSMYYLGDYGFIPQTLWDDNDPLDILILTGKSTYPLTLAKAKVLGVLRMIDNGNKDDKIIAVYASDPRYADFKDIKDIPNHLIKELKHFFETYKELEGKKCQVPEVLGRDYAIKDIKRAERIYKEKFKT